ncbi:lycopene cyclase domain-containing protein [Lutibacter oceani]|uniref:Lycopene cyclase domain-containing protein n=1 Tax=Lutibacter oceani TaxID=1853311 RepID=A0A3D9RJ33_9FLAO|nr:lycopene cyclase domain-containing protein [Lutibacter oceani]REE79870.1 lycopene cyclase domain-containing protein [Lutibacter oceani]
MYLYFLINIASFSVPFLYSFQKKMNFIQYWKSVFLAILIVAIPFLIWDVWFTSIGVWGFNEKYLLGFTVFNLPFEEVLFFFCIPYASIFTHFALLHFFPNLGLPKKVVKRLTILLISGSIIVLFFNYNRLYTLINFSFFAMLLIYSLLCKSSILNAFFITFLVILIPFFIVNGLLTGSFIEEQVVWYNNAENLRIRIGTIPLEDIFYAFNMLYAAIILIKEFKLKFSKQHDK